MAKTKSSVVKSFFRILIAAIFLSGLLPMPAIAQTNGNIAGTVTDNITSNPIQDALVLIFESGAQQPSWTVNTSASGNYTISVPEDTGYSIAARKT